MRWVYIMRFLREFVSNLTTFFVPIHLYRLVAHRDVLAFLPGTELQRGITGIALYFLVYRLVTLLTAIPAARLGTRIGHVSLLLINHLLFIGYLGSLFAGRWHPELIFLAAIFEGLQVSTFWPSYETVMAKAATAKLVGEDLGVLQFLLKLTNLMAPALGGAIIAMFGFSTVCLIGLIGTALSMMAVSQMVVKPETDRVSWAEFWMWLRQSAFDRLALTYFGRYLNDAVLVLWPVYIFLVVGSIERVGFLYSFSLFMALLISFIAGVYVDHARSRKPFYLSGTILSILWVVRSQIWNFWHIAIVNTLDKLTADFHWLFYDALFIKRGQGDQAYSYFTYKEVILSLTALVFWSVVIGLFAVVSNGWTSLFVLAAVGVLLSVLIKDSHH